MQNRLSAIQELYPNPPIRRYHRITPREEEIERVVTVERTVSTNWLYVGIAFVLGYLIGGR